MPILMLFALEARKQIPVQNNQNIKSLIFLLHFFPKKK